MDKKVAIHFNTWYLIQWIWKIFRRNHYFLILKQSLNYVLQNYSSSNKRIITVCGTETASNLLNDPIPPVYNHEETDTLIPLRCFDADSTFAGCTISVHSVDTDVYVLLLDVFMELQSTELYIIAGESQNIREISIKE